MAWPGVQLPTTIRGRRWRHRSSRRTESIVPLRAPGSTGSRLGWKAVRTAVRIGCEMNGILEGSRHGCWTWPSVRICAGSDPGARAALHVRRHSLIAHAWPQATTRTSLSWPGWLLVPTGPHFRVSTPSVAGRTTWATRSAIRLTRSSSWPGGETSWGRCITAKPAIPSWSLWRKRSREYDIPIEPFEALISAFEQDQTVTEYLTYNQLLDYCTRSADPVGHLVLYVAGAFSNENARLADATCTALQLANFWQDVARDLALGRIYLPREDRTTFRLPGVGPAGAALHASVCRDDAISGWTGPRPAPKRPCFGASNSEGTGRRYRLVFSWRLGNSRSNWGQGLTSWAPGRRSRDGPSCASRTRRCRQGHGAASKEVRAMQLQAFILDLCKWI